MMWKCGSTLNNIKSKPQRRFKKIAKRRRRSRCDIGFDIVSSAMTHHENQMICKRRSCRSTTRESHFVCISWITQKLRTLMGLSLFSS
jgi:hypothetical protein